MRSTPASAALVLAGASLVLAAMALLAKEAAGRLPGAEIAFVRFLFGIAACQVAAFYRGLRPSNWAGLALRGVLGGSAVLCYFLAIEHLPVGLATLLNYTAPVFTALWAAAFLGERLDRKTVIALALATSGAALVSGASWGFGGWVLVGALSAVVSVVGQIGLTWSLRYLRAATAGILQQLTPVGALAFGAAVYGERITPLSAAGAALAIAGVSYGAWHMARPGLKVLPEDS